MCPPKKTHMCPPKKCANMSTKDRPGTLPVNAYEEDIGSTELFDFSKLQSGSNVTESAYQEENTRIRHQRYKDDESNTSYVLAKVGEFAAVKHGYSPKELANKPCPFFFVKLQEDVMTNADPVKRYVCFW